jgi:hypothetical protein
MTAGALGRGQYRVRFWLYGGRSHPPFAEASGAALDGNVCFLDGFSVTAGAFALG